MEERKKFRRYFYFTTPEGQPDDIVNVTYKCCASAAATGGMTRKNRTGDSRKVSSRAAHSSVVPVMTFLDSHQLNDCGKTTIAVCPQCAVQYSLVTNGSTLLVK